MNKKLSRMITLCAMFCVSLALAATFAFSSSSTIARADGTFFEMVNGTALRISDDDGGLRFRARMDETTATAVKDGTAQMKFLVAPKTLFDKVTDGDYANGLVQKIEISVDGAKIYKDGDYYYANGVIANIMEANRTLDFCAVAYYTSGEKTTYAATDTSLVRGNVYDVVNQLVVNNGDTYADDILKCKSYEWYGVGDYPIIVDTVEGYNSLAAQVNGGRDFSKYTAKIADEVKSASGKTEITNAEKFPMQQDKYDTSIYKTMIYECAGHSLSDTNGFEKSTEVAAPNGFKNVYKSTTFANFDIGHDLSIANYKKVCFALKSDGKYKHSALGEVDGQSGWVYFELSRESVSSFDWTIRIIDENKVLLFETQRTDNNKWNYLCSILWHGGTDFTMSGASYVYCTELRGVTDDRYNTNSAKWTDTHKFTAEDTENYMVKDGATEYTVVIPSAHGGEINYAKEELVNFFLKRQA